MPYLLADFRADFPEFAGDLDATVERALAIAGSQVSEDVWGDLYAQAMGLKTADVMTRGPLAFDSKPKSAEKTRYLRAFEELAKMVPRRIMVL